VFGAVFRWATTWLIPAKDQPVSRFFSGAGQGFARFFALFFAPGQLSTGKRQKVLIKFDLLSPNFSYDSRLLKQPGSSP